MREVKFDIWKFRQPQDFVIVTTNATLRKDGKLVMGRGIALEASQKYPNLQYEAGNLIRQNGLRTEVIEKDRLILFPVKYAFYQQADINLIQKSLLQFLEIARDLEGGRFLAPRFGAGFGHLDWAEVGPMVRHHLEGYPKVSNRLLIFSK